MTGGAATSPLRLAIIGAGRAGQWFARRCLRAGQSVVLEDVLPAKLRSARQELQQLSLEGNQAHLTLACSVEDAVREADLVVDFVPDELESKLEIFSLLDRMAPPRTILLTPTDTLSIADLASCTYRGDRCFALRGLMATMANDSDDGAKPVPVTLTHPDGEDQASRQCVKDLLDRLGLTYTTIRDEIPSMLSGR